MMDLLGLGDQTYELCGGTGESMTDLEIVADGYFQIGRARGGLNAVSTSPFLRRKDLAPAMTRADRQKEVNTRAPVHTQVSSFSIERFAVVANHP
jgi:hypothetical protein